tara:strand:+ start:3030 stop:3767 length:738 start_codon:yes stop_codon:yes gene_type:complete
MERATELCTRLQAIAPIVAPRVVPRQFVATRSAASALACTSAGRAAVSRAVRRERERESKRRRGNDGSSDGADAEALRFVLLSTLDLAAGAYRVTGARFVSAEVAQLMDMESVLGAVVPEGPAADCEAGLRAAKLFAQLNGHSAGSAAMLQECATVAYALRIVASAMPLKGYLLDVALPLPALLDDAEDASRGEVMVATLLKRGAEATRGGGGGSRGRSEGDSDSAQGGKRRRKKKPRTSKKQQR